jgi:hypothetical protein
MKDRTLRILLIIAIFIVILYDLCPAFISLDTPYFIVAGYHWANGQFDCLRTPIYPLLVYVCSLPFGEVGRMTLIMLVQNIFFLLSVATFYQMANCLIKNRKIAFLLSLYYIITPAAGWCKAIHMDSLNISFCILFTYWLFLLIKRPTPWKGFITSSLALFLILFRSTFIIFLLILPCLYVHQIISRHIKTYWLCLLFLIIPFGGYHYYCHSFQQHFGIYGSSISPICCNYINLWQHGLYNTTCITNAGEINAIHKLDSLSSSPGIVADANYDKLYYLISNDNNADTYLNASQHIINSQKKVFIQAKLKHIAIDLQRTFTPGIGDASFLSSLLFIISCLLALPASFMLLVIVISVLAIMRIMIRKRQLPIHVTLLTAILGCYCGGILFAGSDSYTRLLLPVYPIMLLLIGIGVEHLVAWLSASSNTTC